SRARTPSGSGLGANLARRQQPGQAPGTSLAAADPRGDGSRSMISPAPRRVLPSVTAAAPGRPDRRTAPQRLPCLAMLGSERGPRRALVGAVLAMTVALAACGGDDDESGADAPGREADDTTTTTAEAAAEAEDVSWVA